MEKGVQGLFTLVIVEDEDVIRRGLTDTIDWRAMGFRVLGSYGTGRAALRAVERMRPDVVLTDIRMPGMDGLELLERIKSQLSGTEVVLLSGYEQFSYVRRGINLGAAGYVLKLSLEEDLQRIFARLRETLEASREQAEAFAKSDGNQQQSRVQRAWEKMLDGTAGANEVQVLAGGEKSISMNEGLFSVACLNPFWDSAGQGIRYTRNQWPEAWSRLLSSHLADEHLGLVVIADGDLRAISYTEAAEPEGFQGLLSARWRRIGDEMNARPDLLLCRTMTAGIGSVVQGWQSIHLSCIQARRASRHRTTESGFCVCEWRKFRSDGETRRFEATRENDLIRSIVWGDSERLSDLFVELEGAIWRHDRTIDVEDVQWLLIELLAGVSIRLRACGMSLSSLGRDETEMTHRIQSCDTAEALLAWARKNLTELTTEIQKQKETPARENILRAVDYIKEHYEERFSLEEMAKYACISPAHFSVLFKRITGKTFTEFVISTKMEKARELLRQGAKVREAAGTVGYEDVHYFRKSFKKVFGANPSSYAGKE